VAELKKKSKEQLINYIIDQERKRRDSHNNLISRLDYYIIDQENRRKENTVLEKQISHLETQVEEKEKHINKLIGYHKIKNDDLAKAYDIISNHSKEIRKSVIKKFNSLKSSIIKELIDDKIKILKEQLKLQKDKELIEIFAFLGVSEERLIEIIKEFNFNKEAIISIIKKD
jgi:Iap family predicted aminopeptidase